MQNGRQIAEISAGGFKASFDVAVYNDEEEYVVHFGDVTVEDGCIGFAVVCDSEGRMIKLQEVRFVGGSAIMVLEKDLDAATVKLYVLDGENLELAKAPILPR